MQDQLHQSVTEGVPWDGLPIAVRQMVGSRQEYHQHMLEDCFVRTLSWVDIPTALRESIDEQQYYNDMIHYHRQELRVYPYQFIHYLVGVLQVTPFEYYRRMCLEIMKVEKSYDSLPNFTAMDMLRLIGIGRNQYIDIMNRARAKKMMWKVHKGGLKNFLASKPPSVVGDVNIEPWWTVLPTSMSPETLGKLCTPAEQSVYHHICAQCNGPPNADAATAGQTTEEASDDEADPATAPGGGGATSGGGSGGKKAAARRIKAFGHQVAAALPNTPWRHHGRGGTHLEGDGVLAGALPPGDVGGLYAAGAIYFCLEISDDDTFVVPPLSGFVMNRSTDDVFDKLLYDVMLSIDERTTVAQLAHVMDVDVQLVKVAVSLCCRLGVAQKKALGPTLAYRGDQLWHDGWREALSRYPDVSTETTTSTSSPTTDDVPSLNPDDLTSTTARQGRIAFLFDSTLTAFLMMGNLGVKKEQAVTLYEAGKMPDELLTGLLQELDNVKIGAHISDGEARRYFDHAIVLRSTLHFLRQNPKFNIPGCDGGVDMLRCESLNNLEPQTLMRILWQNYKCVVAMTHMATALQLTACLPSFYGPPISFVGTAWFHLYVLHLLGCGPATVLWKCGSRVRVLPQLLDRCGQLTTAVLSTCEAPDTSATTLNVCNLLGNLNDGLQTNAMMVQATRYADEYLEVYDVPFPLESPLYSKRVGLSGATQGKGSDDLTEGRPRSDSECAAVDLVGDVAKGVETLARRVVDALHLQDGFGYMQLAVVANKSTPSVPARVHVVNVHLGMPLHDIDLNARVCGSIQNNALFTEDTMARHSTNMQTLCTEFLQFMSQWLPEGHRPRLLPPADESPPSAAPVHPGSDAMPLPTGSIAFNGTTLKWLADV